MSLLVFLYGIVIGSFLNVCIYRIPREESIAFPPSHCTNCGYELKWTDLFPILSYIFLRGKCRSCGEKISIKYPLIELLNGAIYVLLFLQFGFSIIFFKYCFFTSIIIVIGMIDFETKFVYRITTGIGLIGGVIFTIIQVINNKTVFMDSLIGLFIGAGIILLIVIITRGMGEGDIEIAALCGLFLGIKGILVTLFLSFVIGGIVSVLILALKLKGRKDEIAFGPYLAIGGMVSMLWGSKILEIYMNVFL